MAGHSKWANIKHKKAAQDAKRGKIFNKLAKEIEVAAKLGGSDENANPRLRTAILKARQANMPKDNIERAIKKGAGELEGVNYEEFVYEGYGPGGTAIIIEVMTDKKSRTLPEIKSIFTKSGNSLAESGAVSYLFDHVGLILVEGENIDEEKLLDIVLESGAEDFELDDEVGNKKIYAIKTAKENFHSVLTALEPKLQEMGLKIVESGLKYVPQTTIALPKEQALKAIKLIEDLENHDDVQNVYTNLEIGEWAEEIGA
ncbi:MAG: YebC/PmpR family DNA-binding transcriptional regulator [Candidatus Hydrogenedentota bacterium]|nr:MAG: YebC/PmpR family DNA-binding transcriptional regulator [Candidatus Hydrogenedentota bacterium]